MTTEPNDLHLAACALPYESGQNDNIRASTTNTDNRP